MRSQAQQTERGQGRRRAAPSPQAGGLCPLVFAPTAALVVAGVVIAVAALVGSHLLRSGPSRGPRDTPSLGYLPEDS